MAISIPSGEFNQPLDVANRACQHVGVRQMTAFWPTDNSKAAKEITACYDSLREWELRRQIWTASIRRCVMRAIDETFGLVTPAEWAIYSSYLLGSLVTWNGVIYQAKAAGVAGLQPDINPASWAECFLSLAAGPWNAVPNNSLPPPWSPLTNYAAYSFVIGSDNNQYYSLINGNLDINPVTDGGVHWQKTGAAPQGNGYFAGEVVYVQVAGSAPQIFLSLSNGNADVPMQAVPQWISTQTYSAGQAVTYSSVVYQSTEDFNLGNTPTGVSPWIVQPGTQADSMIGDNWLLLGGATLSSLNIIYPAGAGPATQVATRNVYKLPNGYLRKANQDPKAGASGYLGAPSNMAYDDWLFENGYLITTNIDPIVFRFAADVRDVSTMEPMFCELLAARIGLEVCEVLTQSATKKNTIEAEYVKFGGEARTIDGIEQGAVYSELDEYLSCRW